MRPHRKIILVVTVLLAGGSLGLTTVYGLRLRSASYRREVERNLTAFFNLPCEVGLIRGLTFSSRSFEDVVIYLQDRRDRVFHCATAIWHENRESGREVNRLDLIDGLLLLGSDRWRRSDYLQVIESGLAHDFEELHLSSVSLKNFEIAFLRRELSIRCREASGTIDLTHPEEGIARLQAYELNGFPINEGVRIHARFSPRNGVEVSELTLSLPSVPLSVIGLNQALGGEITTGRFAGRVQYVRPKESEVPEVWIQGELLEADLAELTRGLPLGPLNGQFSVNVDAARLYGSVVTHLRGRGRITDLSFASLAPLLDLPGLSGSASFDVDQIDLALSRINRLRLAGSIRDLPLQELLQRWGKGAATGTLAIRVNNLDVVDEEIKSADIEIVAVPQEGESGLIDRTLLLGLAENVFDFTWPAAIPQRVLPERLEYVEFGMRLLVRDNRLRILGTHGADGTTILTIKDPFFGTPVGLVGEQLRTIDLAPYIDVLLARLRSYDPDRVREWWGARSGD